MSGRARTADMSKSSQATVAPVKGNSACTSLHGVDKVFTDGLNADPNPVDWYCIIPPVKLALGADFIDTIFAHTLTMREW